MLRLRCLLAPADDELELAVDDEPGEMSLAACWWRNRGVSVDDVRRALGTPNERGVRW